MPGQRYPDFPGPKVTAMDCVLGYWCVDQLIKVSSLTLYFLGWELISADYCKKILEIFAHMYKMREEVLPENRDGVDYYLHKVWMIGAQLAMPMASRNRDNATDLVETKFKDYVIHEEDRIKHNLQRIKYDIDALDTVYIVAGPEQIEKDRVRIEKVSIIE